MQSSISRSVRASLTSSSGFDTAPETETTTSTQPSPQPTQSIAMNNPVYRASAFTPVMNPTAIIADLTHKLLFQKNLLASVSGISLQHIQLQQENIHQLQATLADQQADIEARESKSKNEHAGYTHTISKLKDASRTKTNQIDFLTTANTNLSTALAKTKQKLEKSQKQLAKQTEQKKKRKHRSENNHETSSNKQKSASKSDNNTKRSKIITAPEAPCQQPESPISNFENLIAMPGLFQLPLVTQLSDFNKDASDLIFACTDEQKGDTVMPPRTNENNTNTVLGSFTFDNAPFSFWGNNSPTRKSLSIAAPESRDDSSPDTGYTSPSDFLL